MATELEGIKEVTEAILGIGEVAIDNFTFKVFNQPVIECIKNIDSFFYLKLFYKWSVSLYITGSVLVQANKFFGDALACEGVSRFKYFGWNCAHSNSHLQGEDTVDEEAIANYCMMYSEFLVPDNYLV